MGRINSVGIIAVLGAVGVINNADTIAGLASVEEINSADIIAVLESVGVSGSGAEAVGVAVQQ